MELQCKNYRKLRTNKILVKLVQIRHMKRKLPISVTVVDTDYLLFIDKLFHSGRSRPFDHASSSDKVKAHFKYYFSCSTQV